MNDCGVCSGRVCVAVIKVYEWVLYMSPTSLLTLAFYENLNPLSIFCWSLSVFTTCDSHDSLFGGFFLKVTGPSGDLASLSVSLTSSLSLLCPASTSISHAFVCSSPAYYPWLNTDHCVLCVVLL